MALIASATTVLDSVTMPSASAPQHAGAMTSQSHQRCEKPPSDIQIFDYILLLNFHICQYISIQKL